MSKRKQPQTPWPETMNLSDEMREYGSLHGVDAEVEFDSWRDHHLAKGSMFADWGASFRTWCRNAEKYKNEKRQIGFTAPAAPTQRMIQAMRENELAAQEAAAMTPERRRELGRQFSEMVSKIGIKI